MWSRFTGKTRSQAPLGEEANKGEDRAIKIESAARGLQSGVAAATAVGLTALAASGPALPVVAGIGILAAAATRMYFLNKKLTDLFKRAERLTSRMLPVLKAIEERKLSLNTADVRDAATQLQQTIGELLGPQALKEINEARKEINQDALGPKSKSAWVNRLKRYGRILSPAMTLTRFNEQLLYLGLEFSVLQGEFAVALDKLSAGEAANVAAAAGTTIDPNSVPSTTDAAVSGANTPSEGSNEGGRRTRRRRRAKRTRKNL